MLMIYYSMLYISRFLLLLITSCGEHRVVQQLIGIFYRPQRVILYYRGLTKESIGIDYLGPQMKLDIMWNKTISVKSCICIILHYVRMFWYVVCEYVETVSVNKIAIYQKKHYALFYLDVFVESC